MLKVEFPAIIGTVSTLDKAFIVGKPEIFNSNQGCQFTSEVFTSRLKAAEIQISWNGRGHFWDNIITLVGVTTSVYGEV